MEQVTYKSIEGRDLHLDVFRPPGGATVERRPGMLLFHGGGWVFGGPEKFHPACERYAAKGFVACSVHYRLSMNDDGTYPHPGITPVESVKDARSAVRWVRRNADSLGIDPDRLVCGGQSAGGQLSLATAVADGVDEADDDLTVSPVPNAVLLYSSSVNTVEAWVDWVFGDRRDEIWSISPHHRAAAGMPPVLQFHGEDDATVRPYEVRLFAARMRQLGNEHELHFYPGRRHNLGAGCDRYAGYFDDEILDRTDAFLARHGFLPEQAVAP